MIGRLIHVKARQRLVWRDFRLLRFQEIFSFDAAHVRALAALRRLPGFALHTHVEDARHIWLRIFPGPCREVAYVSASLLLKKRRGVALAEKPRAMGVQYRLLGGARRPLFMTDPASSKSIYPCRWTCIPFHTQGRRELLNGASSGWRSPHFNFAPTLAPHSVKCDQSRKPACAPSET